ncbi:MAG TPA: hypothetical protein VGR47_06865 [Terracidiphilus sp.]|nr:hypothetical protein [Terracidiphilus sp.]
MDIDLRLPVGLMFSLTGLILAAFGLFTNGVAGFYSKSLGININLWWGLVLLIFGGLMALLGLLRQLELSRIAAIQEARNRMRTMAPRRDYGPLH